MQSNRLVVPVGAAVLGLAMGSQSVYAQIVPAADGTGTIATPVGTVTNITGGTVIGPNGNQNQFHSFTQFGVPTGETANFVVDAGTTNVLSRVTGGNPSNINGVLQVSNATNNATANLYIMNPAGVIFGPGASLNVPASFYATTAAGIGFGGNELGGADTQVYFNAYGTNTYANLTNGPTSLSFPPGFTGSVVNLGNLSVPAGQILGLFSNTVVSGADINSPGSFIAGVSVPTPRFIRFRTAGNPLTFEFPTGSFAATPFPQGLGPTALPALITGGSAGATSVRVTGGNVFLTGGGAAGADAQVNAGELAVRNISVSSNPLSAGPSASSIRLVSGGNLIAGNMSNNVAANATLNFGGDVQLISGAFGDVAGGNANGTVQLGNVNAASVDIQSGGAVNSGNFTMQGFTPNQLNSIRIINRSLGNITTGNLVANNVNLTPAAGASGGGNIVITSTGNLTTGTIANNAGVGAAGAAANLPNGGGEVRLISGASIAGGPRGAGTVTTSNISSASIDIDSGGTVNNGNLFTQSFTMAGRPTAIRVISRSGNVNTGSVFANNVNAQGQSAGGGNIEISAPTGFYNSTSTISSSTLGNSSLQLVDANGAATTNSAVSVASRGTITINQLGSANASFLQGGNLQRDSRSTLVYRLSNGQTIRVLIRGINADGSLQLVDATTNQAVSGGNLVIRNATTNRIAVNRVGGGTSGLIIRLGQQGANNNAVTAVAGETVLNTATNNTTAIAINQTAAGATVDTGASVLPLGDINTPPPQPLPTPVNPPVNGNTALLNQAQDVERTPREDDAAPVDLLFSQSDSKLLAADAFNSGSEEGILTQRVERQVPVAIESQNIPTKEEEDPLAKVKPKPRQMRVLPQLW